jgi:surface antigen
MRKLLVGGILFVILFPLFVMAPVITAITLITSKPQEAPATALFSWVPAGGFPDRFPYGQCTWWVAYNRHVTWNGNAGDWLANAKAQGVATSSNPTVGAIVVYPAGRAYSQYGHVAIVTAVDATSYTVSEMNFSGWGQVDTRSISWPDPLVSGFIPLQQGEGA